MIDFSCAIYKEPKKNRFAADVFEVSFMICMRILKL